VYNHCVKKTFFFLSICLGVFSIFSFASAHEVYVLSPIQITQAIGIPPFDMVAVAEQNLGQFTFWAFISILVVFVVFFSSISRFLEKKFDPFFLKIKKYAPAIARVTVGVSFLAAAYYQASYGPELPLAPAYGIFTPVITGILVVIGILIIFNLYTKWAAGVALCLFGYAVYRNGWYMLTYTNYLGEIIVLLLGIEMMKAGKKLSRYGFLIIRVCFGVSLIFASAYAKIIYNNLGLFTVEKYHLDKILGFEPHFLVLGAAIIEILIGTFIILGIEIRFASAFFLFWLSLSLVFFGEVVWPHIILIGIPIALICYGYDKYSIEGYFFKKDGREPVF